MVFLGLGRGGFWVAEYYRANLILIKRQLDENQSFCFETELSCF
ncbi:MAG: hypothetical protein AAGJ08_25545 [Cyanobacteria bacterium P01_H01_bin.35]